MAKTEHIVCKDVKWINVTNPSAEEMEALSKAYNLNPTIVKDCMQPEHLPKYEFVDDVHFLILRFFYRSTSNRLVTIQELTNKIAIFYAEDFLITIQKTGAAFLDAVYKKYIQPGKCTTSSQLLAQIVWQSLETYDDPANRLSDQVDVYENEIMMNNSGTDNIEALYIIKRQASVSHKVLMLMLEPINHIYIKTGEETALQDVRDQHLKMQMLYNQILEDVNNLLNLSMSFSAQRTNAVMKVLTVFSVFFMPLTFIAGIYGMNFDYMPELHKRWGYPAAIGLMVIVAVVIYVWFKKKRWL